MLLNIEESTAHSRLENYNEPNKTCFESNSIKTFKNWVTLYDCKIESQHKKFIKNLHQSITCFFHSRVSMLIDISHCSLSNSLQPNPHHLTVNIIIFCSKLICHRKKKTFFKVFKLTWYKCITTVSKENVRKKSETDHGELQQHSTQRLIDEYGHMNSRNERWMMRLKAIEAEYYPIEN